MSISKKPYLTKQEWIFNELKEKIENCELMPGERLLLDQIAEDFNVSRIPAREALLQLQSEGLVEMVPHCGAIVSPIELSSATDYYTVSRALQVLAIRALIERASEDEVNDIANVVYKMEEIAKSGNREEYSELNHEFHDKIAEYSKMPLIPEFLSTFQQKWHRFECYYKLYPMSNDRIDETLEEHRAILDAILMRDAEKAEEATKKHNLSGLAEHIKRMTEREEKDS